MEYFSLVLSPERGNPPWEVAGEVSPAGFSLPTTSSLDFSPFGGRKLYSNSYTNIFLVVG